MVGVEVDFIVKDSLAALARYEQIFSLERIEVTDFKQGENEVIFSLYGMRFHMLDENPQFGMKAPAAGQEQTIWFNVMVPDIKQTYAAAMKSGCREIQPVTEIPEMGVANAVFSDGFGYQWMLHQIYREVSFEDRKKLWEDRK